MSQQKEAPPPGVEVIPDDVQEEMNRVEGEAQKKMIQKVMDDPEFGRKLLNDPESALTPEVLDEFGVGDEVEGHWPYRSKWRYKCYYSNWYGWAHYKRGYWWF